LSYAISIIQREGRKFLNENVEWIGSVARGDDVAQRYTSPLALKRILHFILGLTFESTSVKVELVARLLLQNLVLWDLAYLLV
jgi:hypothetical protein